MPLELDFPRPRRNTLQAVWRGFALKCPSCGRAALFRRYLKVWDRCPGCAEELHHHRADDAPAYFTILVVGHFIIGGVLGLERALSPPDWVHFVIWVPLTLASTLWLLPRVKGALIGLQWALYMHGFDRARGASEPGGP
jgi:uncharacterized protein (DUF983 family)